MPGLALIIGTGQGLSASLARKLAKRGYHLVLTARDVSDLDELVSETNATAIACDASSAEQMQMLFSQMDGMGGALEVATYNPSYRVRGPIDELSPMGVQKALMVSAYGAFLMAHHAAPRMKANGKGTMLFTGASAGVKGFANSAPFAMGKFALRGLCQSLARELHPQNIHIGHFVIDGGIAKTSQSGRSGPGDGPDNTLDPDSIAESYLALMDQHRSSWSWEVELRPWVERF